MVFFGSCNEYTQPYVSPIFGGDGLDMYVIAFARLSADTALHFARLTVKITALYFVYISGSCTEHAHSCISPVCEMHSPTFPPPFLFLSRALSKKHIPTFRLCKSCSTSTSLNTHTPLTQRSRSWLTMPLSRHSVGTYQETSSHATCQGTLGHSRLS